MLRVLISLLFLSFFLPAVSSYGAEPYYGFYPSKLGPEFKKFTHNIFGFSIDMPSNWTFGVQGAPPTTVVILFPEWVRTESFSDKYETISIGMSPIQSIDLNSTYEYTIKGMKYYHSNMKMLSPARPVKINKVNSLTFKFQWTTKKGVVVIEEVFLVPHGRSVYSVTKRGGSYMFREDGTLYDSIVNTFQVHTPLY